MLFFLARVTPTGRPVSRDFSSEIQKVEFLLIGAALDVNRDLLNVRESQFLSELKIPGFIGFDRGRPSVRTAAFAKMLGYSDA